MEIVYVYTYSLQYIYIHMLFKIYYKYGIKFRKEWPEVIRSFIIFGPYLYNFI